MIYNDDCGSVVIRAALKHALGWLVRRTLSAVVADLLKSARRVAWTTRTLSSVWARPHII